MSLPLILGSTSPFRAEILQKLCISFDTAAPDINESPLANESPSELVERLSVCKAKKVAETHPAALIVGSDQVACVDQQILGKPHTHENAIEQLRFLSGKIVSFHTGLCLFNSESGNTQSTVEVFKVYFRALSDDQIERYLQNEQPYNCAGSFKSEALGISLFKKLEGDDPNTLIGLPLIRLVEFLSNEGLQ
ncbi:MAG: Maf family protein, partial [Sedimenticolaceae bacterium]